MNPYQHFIDALASRKYFLDLVKSNKQMPKISRYHIVHMKTHISNKMCALLLIERREKNYCHFQFDVWCTFGFYVMLQQRNVLHPINKNLSLSHLFIYLFLMLQFFANFTRSSHLRIPITQCRLFYFSMHVKFCNNISIVEYAVWAFAHSVVIDTWA